MIGWFFRNERQYGTAMHLASCPTKSPIVSKLAELAPRIPGESACTSDGQTFGAVALQIWQLKRARPHDLSQCGSFNAVNPH
jgi:hypothetical protein